jgi:hypothetical protein
LSGAHGEASAAALRRAGRYGCLPWITIPGRFDSF